MKEFIDKYNTKWTLTDDSIKETAFNKEIITRYDEIELAGYTGLFTKSICIKRTDGQYIIFHFKNKSDFENVKNELIKHNILLEKY